MKISFNFLPTNGPYGGGNAFVKNLSKGLSRLGHEVSFDLRTKDLDFIIVLDPRWRHDLASYNSKAIVRYLFRNPDTIVLHRINECDERKNTRHINHKLRKLNYLADHTILVGQWMTKLNLFDKSREKINLDESVSVIHNGSDKSLFFPKVVQPMYPLEKVKLVTHHWSSHVMKGLETYLYVDRQLEESNWKSWLEFTYIGNLKKPDLFRSTRIIPPLGGVELADELRKHHVYISASQNEPGGNHQNEAGLTGLPIIFLNSGCLPEYCEGFGVKFSSNSEIFQALQHISSNYDAYRKKMFAFPHTHERMIQDYNKLLLKLDSQRSLLLENRHLFRRPLTLARLLFPI
jgi:hypothetical protein